MRLLPIVLLLVLTACGDAQMPGTKIDAGLASMVPPDTVMLMGVRMEALRSTAIYQKLLARQRLSELDDFAKRTNFDPRKDVREMLIASDGVSTVVLARGNFRLAPLKDTKQSTYKGATLYSQGGSALAILDAATAVAGNEPVVRKVIDQKQARGPAPTGLFDKARTLSSASQVWAVTLGWGKLGDQMMPQSGNAANLTRILKSLETSTLHADFRTGVDATIDGVAKTEQDAKTLGDALRGFVGLGRLTVPENQPQMLQVFDGIKVDQQQRSLRVTIQIPADLVDQLLKMTEPGRRL